MGVRGDFAKLQKLKANLRTLPASVAHEVAQNAAPDLTSLATKAFDTGRNVYGESRPKGAQGQSLDLEVTGNTRRSLKFDATGTVVRAVLGTTYAKYLIGRYGILPNGALPAAWQAALRDLAAQAVAGARL